MQSPPLALIEDVPVVGTIKKEKRRSGYSILSLQILSEDYTYAF
jgi:hypothetical protein